LVTGRWPVATYNDAITALKRFGDFFGRENVSAATSLDQPIYDRLVQNADPFAEHDKAQHLSGVTQYDPAQHSVHEDVAGERWQDALDHAPTINRRGAALEANMIVRQTPQVFGD
jgi:hypothetical protein